MTARYQMKILTDFAAAHHLRGYEGPCSRVHGHNWKVEVQVSASKLDEIGMGLDFKLIKQATNKLIDRLDHQDLNALPPFDQLNPTAENIAAYLYSELSATLNTDVIRVASVTLWETDRACVIYTEE
ncbi:6-carboxytetrahydropterin synthase @ Queuosine biosynthesis QueD, PTPS-I [hydrothermal vent metagenome]|uniref:6-carboxytetrahydropterin synthase @ Queuosine biosynthesis QueD, PTPS-I n=1 Tax=hydrothermal vent metagenome TaxID=652676 RepID=A0A3B1BJF6_9ZZZZ